VIAARRKWPQATSDRPDHRVPLRNQRRRGRHRLPPKTWLSGGTVEAGASPEDSTRTATIE